MSISTRRGDDGTTRLIYGERVSKASPRVECVGSIDELGAFLGLARAFAQDDPLAERLERLQRLLFTAGALLATAPADRSRLKLTLDAEEVARLDAEVAELEAIPGLLSDWALPGATPLGSYLDVARTVCRRAERCLVKLTDAGEEDHPHLPAWLNRLADVLWLYARWYETRTGADGALGAWG
ncbi:MAG: cob(I)yrinic acid a,c-diamide adenosyltransferase [Armatimonadetes bacterium]|nr:cob(I)yrinic acid a,c-diamide adenosyltransferase [Armatimonadota bacterium]